MAETTDISVQIGAIQELSQSMKEGVLGAREDLVVALRSLLVEVETPEDRIWRLLWAEQSHHAVLNVANDLKFWKHLAAKEGSPKTSEQLATMCSADPVLVRRMLKMLASMGTVKEVDTDLFANTAMSALLARAEYSMSVHFMENTVNHAQSQAAPFFKATNYRNPADIRDGLLQYAYDCKGKSFFEWGSANGTPPAAYQFGQMLTAWSENRRHWMDSGYYPVAERLAQGTQTDKGAVLLVDVGGSIGHDLEQFHKRHPHVPGRLILQDLPDIIAQAKPAAPIEATVHDFFTPQPVAGARAYYLHSILHDWSDNDCLRILSNLIPALKTNYSKILVQEMIVPDRGARWQLTSLDWQLMGFFSGQERTESEWRALFGRAGLEVVGVWRHPLGIDALIEVALPPGNEENQ